VELSCELQASRRIFKKNYIYKNMLNKNPKVFISYSHDSPIHIDKVWEFSNKLRTEGIDCILDQYEESPPEGWPRWMDKNIRLADFVIMICTKIYNDRVMGIEKKGIGHGVIWEGNLIFQHLYNSGTINQKFIPVIFENGSKENIPTPIQGSTFYNVDNFLEFERLYNRLRGVTKQKPELGELRELLPEKERKSTFATLHFDSANTLFCKYIDEQNIKNGHIALLLYGMKISNNSANSFTIKDFLIEYTFEGRKYYEISHVIITGNMYSPLRKKNVDVIIVSISGKKTALIDWINIRSNIGEYKLIQPGGIIAGSALFLLNFKNINEVKKINDLKVIITDYSNNKSVHNIEIKDDWIKMGQDSFVNPIGFSIDKNGKIEYS